MSDLAEIWTVSATQNNSGYGAVFCLIQETVWARIQEMGRVQNGVVFSCCGYFLYSLGVNFDSSEMIYINIHQRNKRNGPDTGLVWSMPGILGASNECFWARKISSRYFAIEADNKYLAVRSRIRVLVIGV